jgi:hypothetical protein
MDNDEFLQNQKTIRIRGEDQSSILYKIATYDNDGGIVAVNLTGSTVTIFTKLDEAENYAIYGGTCIIEDALDGLISYEFASAETATSGMYRMWFNVLDADGKLVKYPQHDYQWLMVI